MLSSPSLLSGVVASSVLAAATMAGVHIANAQRGDGPGRPHSLSPCVFAYVPGPRTKTPAENAWLGSLHPRPHANSMTLAPEVVLLGELGIPTAAVVVGHKHVRCGGGTSGGLAGKALPPPSADASPPHVFTFARREEEGTSAAMSSTLHDSRAGLEKLVLTWLLQEAGWVPPGEQDAAGWYSAQLAR